MFLSDSSNNNQRKLTPRAQASARALKHTAKPAKDRRPSRAAKFRPAAGRSLQTGWQLVMAPVIAFLCAYLLEAFTHQPWEMPFGQQLFNAVFYLFFLLFWLGVTGRGSWAAGLTGAFSILAGYANLAVLTFRDAPILPWDLLSMRTALSVSDNYHYPLPQLWWLILLLTVCLILIASGFRIRLQRLKLRLLLVLCGLILLSGYAGVLQNHRFTTFFHFNETLFTPGYLYRQNGFVPSFLMNLRYLKVSQPDGYSVEQLERLATDIRNQAAANEPANPEPFTGKPNLIVIMNEAFSDLSVLSDFSTNEDYMPFLRSLSDNTVRGNLYVSVIGGNTATTEFEFLTGDSMAFLPTGSVAYQQFVHADHPGLPTALKKLGYRAIAMHPYGAGGWNRDTVYDFLGFDEALFYDDFTHREFIRQYVSDRSVYAQLIDSFEQKQADERLFCFAVTMQNHGGYAIDYENFTPTIEIDDDGHDFTLVNRYLSLIRESDAALKELVDYFSQVEEPSVILFFGDHQPHDQVVSGLMAQNTDGLSEQAMAQNRQIVPFVIWANYDIKESAGLVTSANFLSSLLLETAGLPHSAYSCFLADLSGEIPAMTANFFVDASGQHIHYADANPDQQARFADYERLQYNHLIDVDNRLNDLFDPVQRTDQGAGN